MSFGQSNPTATRTDVTVKRLKTVKMLATQVDKNPVDGRVELQRGRPRQRNPGRRVRQLHQAGAIDGVLACRSEPVRRPDPAHGVLDHGRAKVGHEREEKQY